MIKVLVTGANGQIAQELIEIIQNAKISHINFLFYTKEQWDISNSSASLSILQNEKPQYLINTAAYTKVDLAEQQVNQCLYTNTFAPTQLAFLCKQLNVKFIHFSSDYVFQRSNSKLPFLENSIKNPSGIYSISKALSEDQILLCNSAALIIRTSWIYSAYGHNFVKTMINLAKNNDELKVVCDQIGCPTYAANIAKLLIDIIQHETRHNDFLNGLYNFTDFGSTTWFEFSLKIFEFTNQKIKVIPISTQEFGAAAPRPSFSVLNCTKIVDKLGIQIPSWTSSLNTCIEKLRGNEFF